jgi:HSP20 family protein
MAHQQTSAPRPGQGQEHDGGNAGTHGAQGTQGSQATQGRAASGTSPGGEQRPDLERQRQVSREGGATGTSAGKGMQRGPGQGGAMVGGRGQGQPSVLPALMANPWLMTNAFMSNPFGFAQAMSEEMDRLFSSSGDVSPYGRVESGGQPGRSIATQGGQRRMGGQWMPQLEVRQRGNELVVSADLPGLKPEDVEIEIDDGVLTISGERQQSSEDRDQGFYRSERSYGAFSRSIALPEGVDEDQVQARFEHGVLEVTVPLPQQRQRGRRVQIQAGGAKPGSPRQDRGAESSPNAAGSHGAT